MSNYTTCSDAQNPSVGVLYVIHGSFYVPFYVVCMWVMCQKPFITRSCYKIMVAIGVSDICLLSVSTILDGYWSIYGMSICNSYWKMKIAGAFVNGIWHKHATKRQKKTFLAAWIGHCALCVALAVNRASQSGHATTAEPRFFTGKRPWLWMLVAVIYSSLFFIMFLTPCCTMVYHSDLGLWKFDPESDQKESFGGRFELITIIAEFQIGLIAHFVNNSLFSVAMIALYGRVMIATRRIANSDGQSSMTSAERSILIQSFIVCWLAALLALSYLIVPLFTTNIVALVILSLFAQFVSGSNALVYLTMNKAIQKKIHQSCSCPENKVESTIGESQNNLEMKMIKLKPRPATTEYTSHK